jgi:hypothetical protein
VSDDARPPAGTRTQPNHNWTKVREPLARTLARNITIAVVVGTVMAFRNRDPGLLVPLSVLALWFSLGGHYVEVLFLNGLRPRIARARPAQLSARLAVWFAGGAMLYLSMAITARFLPVRPPSLGSWWVGGLAFIGLELLVHALGALRGLPNFYDGGG